MIDPTSRLIEQLAADAQPVRRLRPPALRAAFWLAAVGIVVALAIYGFSDLDLFLHRLESVQLDCEIAAMLLTGVLAVIAAFELSLPDRSPFWAVLPLPPLAVWFASMGYNCYQHWFTDGWALGSSWACLKFVVGASLPLGGTLFFLLYRAAPLAPVRVATFGGLGVASIAAFALQFFHPFDVTFMDLATQMIVVGLVVLAANGYARLRRGQTR